jgi:hypothetical protein
MKSWDILSKISLGKNSPRVLLLIKVFYFDFSDLFFFFVEMLLLTHYQLQSSFLKVQELSSSLQFLQHDQRLSFYDVSQCLHRLLTQMESTIRTKSAIYTKTLPAILLFSIFDFLPKSQTYVCKSVCRVWQKELNSMILTSRPPKNIYDNFHYYQPLAFQGNPFAQAKLAECYQYGYGVRKNPDQGYKWAKLSANQNEPEGFTALAYCFQKGEGLEDKNLNTALELYEKAAEKENARACCQLGFFLKDEKEKLRLYHFAAQRGYHYAQSNLGLRYELGMGVKKNIKTALLYYQLAAAQGVHGVKEELLRLQSALNK